MVAACYKLDGGKAKYKTMYDCARAICQEEDLKFEDFFPVKPTAAPAVLSHRQTPHSESASSVVRPTLDEAALYGITGEIMKRLEPEIESSIAGVLVELLVSLGNAIGRGPYYQVGDTCHFTNEFLVKVGESARARKGSGKDRNRAIMRQVDSEWLNFRNLSGFGSGEAIIQDIRDSQDHDHFNQRTGELRHVITDTGIPDKRLCISVGEFQGILTVCHRPDNLLSSILRDGWDGLPLHNRVKANPASCLKPMLSILADTTCANLSVSLSQADRNNGFANRFLWVYIYRTKYLPDGGEQIDWSAEAEQLREALEFARGVKRVFMDKPAHDRWHRTVYRKLELEIPGLVGSLTSRASAHTTRLAMLYALLDKSDQIRLEHLKAAEALWQYCQDSVQTIFGDLLSPEQTKLMEFLTAHGPAIKKQIIHGCFQGHRKADLIQADLDTLRSKGKVAVSEDDVPRYHAVGRK